MTSLFRKFKWWLERRRKEDDLREELEFHLSEETDDRQAEGLTVDQARQAARRDLGNVTLVREDARALWTWTLVEQLAQDVQYALRTMIRNPGFSGLAVLTLALGIGANTAIYSFMDSILIRSLPVQDPASLAVVKWRSQPVNFGAPGGPEFVLHSIDGSTWRESGGVTAAIFPYPAFERLQEVAGPSFSTLFAYRVQIFLQIPTTHHQHADSLHFSHFRRGFLVPLVFEYLIYQFLAWIDLVALRIQFFAGQ